MPKSEQGPFAIQTAVAVNAAWEAALLKAPLQPVPPTEEQLDSLDSYFRTNRSAVANNLRSAIDKVRNAPDLDRFCTEQVTERENEWDMSDAENPKVYLTFQASSQNPKISVSSLFTIKLERAGKKIKPRQPRREGIPEQPRVAQVYTSQSVMDPSDLEVAILPVKLALIEFASTLPSVHFPDIDSDMQNMVRSIIETEARKESSNAVSAIAADISCGYKALFQKEIGSNDKIQLRQNAARDLVMHSNGVVVPFHATVITDNAHEELSDISAFIKSTLSDELRRAFQSACNESLPPADSAALLQSFENDVDDIATRMGDPLDMTAPVTVNINISFPSDTLREAGPHFSFEASYVDWDEENKATIQTLSPVQWTARL